VPPPTRVSPEAPAAPPRVSPELPPPSRAVVDRPGEPALLAAFLRGAGIVESQLPGGLTAETLEAIGRVLREAIQGTLDLLRARGLTKSEMRADVTVITAVDNNPLKFSPTVEVALGHLLAPHGRGFLPPLRAIQEAYDDLRAHQFGVLAGMRAALEEVLARFAPSELEQQLSEPSALDSLLPINRKAKEWDLFVEHYETIAGQAREDFNAVFGSAFRRAYEAQVRQLRAQVRQG
jgi:FHA domain-containing protein